MIINGEKVPAFSATTLSIPDTPKDNFDAIVAHSREYYARPRLEVEAEIRETIEQSEKYKKELSDSGRQEEPKMVINTNSKPVFKPVSTPSNSASQRPARPFTKSVANAEQKPNLRYQPTPQADFRRQNISPNAAEGKERMGLKDLAKLIAEDKENTETTGKEITKEPVRIEKEQPKKGKTQKNRNRKKGNKKSEKDPQKKTRGDKILTATGNAKSTPVKPEVEYQEKSVVEIRPSHNSLPLSTPVKNTDNYASKDNSVDGILSIKH